MSITFPPDIKPAKVRKLAAEHERLVIQQNDARVEAKRAHAAITAATAADGRAFADALRAGRAAPAETETHKAETKAHEADRRLEALTLAVTECEQDLTAAINETRAKWLTELNHEAEQHRANLLAAVEQLADANLQLHQTQQTVRWLDQFTHRGHGKSVLFGGSKIGHGVLTTWRQPDGSHLSLNALFDALREYAKPRSDNTQPRVIAGVGSHDTPLDPDRNNLRAFHTRQHAHAQR